MRILKIIFLCLTAALVLSVFTACGGDSGNAGQNSGENVDENSENAPENQNPEENQAEVKILPDLPEVNYDGYKFTVLSMTDENEYERDDFWAEEFTGEIINDAKYARNLYVEDKYGVNISTVNIGNFSMGNGTGTLRREISAGDFGYDAAVLSVFDAANSTTNSLLMDLNDMPMLDLSKPWWDQRANEELAIRGRMFFTTGDISAAMGGSIWVTAFNKKLLQEYSIEDPYALVKSGNWTYDKLTELSRMVSEDLNGDGIMNQYDRFGITAADDIIQAVINATGEKCAVINAGGDIELSILNERTIAAYEKIAELIWDADVMFQFQRISDETGPSMFEHDQALFMPGLFRHVVELRTMETDFGILPMPKLDESQSEYYSSVNTWWALFTCVPALQENPERTAVILEALAAESRYTVRPAYYEKSLIGKHIRDDESEEMLDIIYETRTYDFGWYYQIGGFDMGLVNIMRANSGTFISTVERAMGRVERDIERINNLFNEFID